MEDSAPFPLRHYLGVVRVRKWSIVVVMALVVGAVMLLSSRQTPIYESTASVLVKPERLSANSAAQPMNLDTEQQVAGSLPVATVAAETLKAESGSSAPTPDELLKGLTVDVAQNTEVLVFRVRHTDPPEAQRRAAALSNGYIENRKAQVRNDLADITRTLRKRLIRLQEKLAVVNEQLQATIGVDNDPSRINLQNQATLYTTQIGVIQQRLSDASSIALDPRVGEVLKPAGLPGSPASPNYKVNLAFALLGGLVLGLGFAFLRERFDDRLQGDLDVRTRSPILATVPHVSGWSKDQDTPLITITEPGSEASEAYRALRTGLLFTAHQHGVKTIVVTSAHASEGKTTTTANLGVVLAQAGKRVILVSADLRKPRLHKFFNASNAGPGLSDVLSGRTSVWAALIPPNTDHLATHMRFLPSGAVPGNPAELLGSEAMGRCLAELSGAADFLLIDSPPILAVADTIALGPMADALLFVADAERTPGPAVSKARQQLDLVNARVIGAVLNNYDASKSSYGYRYRYYEEYAQEESPNGSRGR